MIIFQNTGLIDVAAVTTMGVSVKEAGSIGYFGTGLKFAIATILREGGTITIWRGTEPFRFTSSPLTVRQTEFQQVMMNGTPLGFTNQLGRDWETWMAFRELASNCRDEGGQYWKHDDREVVGWFAAEDMTTIEVDHEAMNEVWYNRRSILLEGKPLYSTEHANIYEGTTPYAYYRGVRVHTHTRPFAFTYNVKSEIDLTEDRTAKNWWQLEHRLEKALGACEDRALLRKALTCGEMYAEHYLDVPAYGDPGPVFRELARELTLGAETVSGLNPAMSAFARATALADLQPKDSLALDLIKTRMLDRALSVLNGAGWNVAEFPVIVAELGPGMLGLAKDGKVFISPLAFEKGTREVASTLLEEYAHLKSGSGDCTREFQNWLFDQLLSQSEQVAGEPF